MKSVKLWLLLLIWMAAPAVAQNVSNYASVPEPLLFLVREPAVQQDLGLSAQQRQRLIALNESVDGLLLASRNQQPQDSQKAVADVLARTRQSLAELLTQEQQDRIQQIRYRLRGLPFVLLPEAAERLGLTNDQKQEIEGIVAETHRRIQEVFSPTYEGPEEYQKSQQMMQTARQDEQERILAALTTDQRRTLLALVGRPFDTDRLGHVMFNAPELAAGDTWINSEPTKLADLRGKVIALNFWAFGCSNCIANYPWYHDWSDRFAGQDFVQLGIHTPETPGERDPESVRQKVREAGFEYPVVIDNEKQNWDAWGNSMWPSVYLIDKQGRLRYWWYGELNWNGAGGQTIMAEKIRELLSEQYEPSAREVSATGNE